MCRVVGASREAVPFKTDPAFAMNVVFAGTPVFAQRALQSILDAGFNVSLVLTQPDRPAGRGLKLQPSAVKQLALTHGIALAQPQGLRLDGRFAEDAALARQALLAAQADVMLVAAYGLILPQWVLDLPRCGCINIHASLLPRWRGAAPIHRAIEAGDAQTGITIMQMDAGLDTGDMLAMQALAISPTDTTATLHDRLALLGGEMAVDVLQRLQNGPLQSRPQPMQGVCYAPKIAKSEGRIDWRESAAIIERRVRALSPAPGASFLLGDEAVKVLCSEINSCQRTTGKRYGHILAINPEGITVACGEGALLLTRLQRPGGKSVSAADFARGASVQVGMVFGGANPPDAAR